MRSEILGVNMSQKKPERVKSKFRPFLPADFLAENINWIHINVVLSIKHFNPRSGMRYSNIHCVTGKGFCLKNSKKNIFGTMASTSITPDEAQPQYT